MSTITVKILLLERMQKVVSGTLTFPPLEEQELDIADTCPPLSMASPLIKEKCRIAFQTANLENTALKVFERLLHKSLVEERLHIIFTYNYIFITLI